MANSLVSGALNVGKKAALSASGGSKSNNSSSKGANPYSSKPKSYTEILADMQKAGAQDPNKNPGTPSSSWGYGGWGGGGGGSTGPTDEQEDAAIALGGVAAGQAKAAKDKFNNVKDTINAANLNAKKTADLATHAIGRSVASEWYHNAYENPQKIAAAMKEKAQQALSGSTRWAFNDNFQRVVDDATVDVINNEIEQKNDVMYELANTINKNITEQNKMAADIEGSLYQGAADFFTQLINMHPDLVGKDGPFGQLLKSGVFKTDNAKQKKANAKVSQNKAAGTISYPSFLSPGNFYKENKGEFVTPKYINFGREGLAREKARSKQTVSQPNVASAANPEYLNWLSTDYGSRRI